MNDAVKAHWERRFEVRGFAHRRQNALVTEDLIVAITSHKGAILDVFQRAKSVVEFGCGTGELIAELAIEMGWKNVLGTDISEKAIHLASEEYARPGVRFLVHDLMEPMSERFDLALCSNVIEHFRNPDVAIDRMLESSTFLMVVVPYMESELGKGKTEWMVTSVG